VELARRDGVTLQVGGSDQWGNITAGADLVRRMLGKEVHALTLPLVTTAAGTKFGKTEAGAVWLDPARTSPYRFFQFWVNADDRDVPKYLRFFTLMPREEVEAREAEMAAHPERREAQRALAREVTERVHGAEAARVAEEVSQLLFGKGDATALSERALEELAREIPFAELSAADIRPAGEGSEGIGASALFAAAGLAKSKGEARRLLAQGGLNLNGRRLGADDETMRDVPFLRGRHLLLRKGARDYALVRVTE
jgi:tyrosyl-tRNA synthetase